VEALITILLIILLAGFFLRHFGAYLLRFLLRRMARRFGAGLNAFDRSGKGSKAQPPEPPAQEQIIPNSVGEYVDYEEVE
jgi:hypothetical protein